MRSREIGVRKEEPPEAGFITLCAPKIRPDVASTISKINLSHHMDPVSAERLVTTGDVLPPLMKLENVITKANGEVKFVSQ